MISLHLTQKLWKKFPISVYEREALGHTAYKSDADKDHPLLEGLPDIISLEGMKLYMDDWFPKEYIENLPSLIDFQTNKKRLFSGWFKLYDKKWEALLFMDKDRNYPILLCRLTKSDGSLGAYIITTMYLCSSELIQLIRNILNLPETGIKYLENLETKKRLYKEI